MASLKKTSETGQNVDWKPIFNRAKNPKNRQLLRGFKFKNER